MLDGFGVFYLLIVFVEVCRGCFVWDEEFFGFVVVILFVVDV